MVPSDELQGKKELEPGETFTEGLYYSMCLLCEIAKESPCNLFSTSTHPAFDLHGPSLDLSLSEVTSCIHKSIQFLTLV